MEVQVLARKLIKPSKPTPLHLQNLKLSLFDQLAPPLYVSIVFYYSSNAEENAASKRNEKFILLEESLSKTLNHYYPMVGRFSNNDLLINCNDQGVEFIEAQVEKDLGEFLHHGPEIELLNKFMAWDVPPSTLLATSPMLAIQVTMFSCGGLVMGIQCSHLVADAFTLEKFINKWACISKSGVEEMSCSSSFGDLASLFPTRVLSKQLPPRSKLSKIITRRFVFDAQAIETLKKRIFLKDATIEPTRVVTVISLLWKALTGAYIAKNGYLKNFSLCPTINLRERTVLPITQQSLGNFWMSGIALFQADKNGTELHDYVKLMTNAIRDTTMNVGKASIDEISDLFIKNYKEIVGKLVSSEKNACPFTSWCKFSWYEADFGWGKPIWLSGISRAFEVISLIDTKNGDGIEAWVSLKEEIMVEFEQDPDILSLASKMKSPTCY
ncbi:acetyl-CoA-benzylalcohol acetyltransferase-like [Lycium barbarum]|uniref:acetyl-CoA-benzylalcohol acetyltransferase-like n=1 Tax=Lycium barbarum TaxID=112863 RepID=UPI00293E347B|nr:acetyl-CoA-benzylalcohol acetyltransferase-like [Lycium barbarum]